MLELWTTTSVHGKVKMLQMQAFLEMHYEIDNSSSKNMCHTIADYPGFVPESGG